MTYSWVLLSLFCAFALATSDALTKKALVRSNEYLAAWFRLFFSLPLLLLLWTVVPTPKLDAAFYTAFIFSLPLEIAAMILYVKALKVSPLSLTLPFLSLTPVLLIVVSYIVLGEKVSFQGSIGIVVLAAGGYTLHLHEIRNGLLMPFKAIRREKGSLLMIAVAIIYSVTASLGKMAIEHSSPLFFGVTYFCAVTVLFAPIALWMGRHDMRQFISTGQYKRLFFPGLFYSIMIASHMTALNLTKVAYMISVKRISLVIGVLYGHFLFRETNIRERMTGALLMLTGFVLIVTAG
jgi:drug/metabolite transporter (DMT)-like permease